MYRLAMLVAVLILLAAVGCGGSGDDSDSASPAAAEAGDSAPSDAAGDSASNGDAKKKTDADQESSEDEDAGEDGTPKKAEENGEDAFTKLAPKRKTQLVETVLRTAALRFGLKLVDVQLRRDGRAATATVARKGACNFVARQEANMMVVVKEGVPGLKSVRWEVAGTGQELGYYVLGCKRPEIPSGAGRVILDHSGVGGPYASKPFEIKSKRWALEWENQAGSLAVILSPLDKKAKKNYAKPVGSQKPESGRYEYTGGGTYRLQAYGAGGWRVRVKEIG